MSRPGGVKDSHPLNTTETGDKRRLHGPLGSYKGISYTEYNKKASIVGRTKQFNNYFFDCLSHDSIFSGETVHSVSTETRKSSSGDGI